MLIYNKELNWIVLNAYHNFLLYENLCADRVAFKSLWKKPVTHIIIIFFLIQIKVW